MLNSYGGAFHLSLFPSLKGLKTRKGNETGVQTDLLSSCLNLWYRGYKNGGTRVLNLLEGSDEMNHLVPDERERNKIEMKKKKKVELTYYIVGAQQC